jgi:hypothetical protein
VKTDLFAETNMQFLKLILGFSPWLAFMFIAHDSLFRLKLGLAVALVLSIVMGVLRLHRGVILWAGLAFFVYATVAVAGFEHMWTVSHMGILAHGTLGLSTWYTVIVKRPFTLDYAREQTDPALWNHPSFIGTNMILSAAWGVVFTLGAANALRRLVWHSLADWQYEVVNYAFMLTCVVFTTVYPGYVRRRRLQAEKVLAAGDKLA